MLNDKHINYSQEMLKVQFKDAGIAGLQSTLTLSKQTSRISSNKYLQIIHCRQNHWTVTSTIGSNPEVLIYDFIYESVDKATLDIIKQLFGFDITIKVADGPKQEGISDCGLFTIATCVSSLAYGQQPAHYLQNCMINHLINMACLLYFLVMLNQLLYY